MTPRLQRLFDVLGRESLLPKERLGEITIEVPAAEYLQVCRKLRDHPDLRFEQLMDLTGVDYASYGDKPRAGLRFAVALHLLSVTHNWRLRVRAFCPDDQFPLLPSVFARDAHSRAGRGRGLHGPPFGSDAPYRPDDGRTSIVQTKPSFSGPHRGGAP